MGEDRESPGYAEAMAELECIVAELEDDHLDIDLLATRVQRAADLIAVCRERLAAARVDVERIVTSIDEDG